MWSTQVCTKFSLAATPHLNLPAASTAWHNSSSQLTVSMGIKHRDLYWQLGYDVTVGSCHDTAIKFIAEKQAATVSLKPFDVSVTWFILVQSVWILAHFLSAIVCLPSDNIFSMLVARHYYCLLWRPQLFIELWTSPAVEFASAVLEKQREKERKLYKIIYYAIYY